MLQGMLPGMQPGMQSGNQQGMVVGQPFPGQPALRLPNLQQSQNAQMGLPPVQVPQGGPDAGQNNLPYQPDVNGNPMPTEPAQPPATAPKFQ